MIRVIAWGFAIAVAAATVLLQPIVHTAKSHLTGDKHYNAFKVRETVRAALQPNDIIMVQPDHLMSPFDDLVHAHYASGGKGRIFFPFGPKERHLERETLIMDRLVCYVAAFNPTGIVFGLHPRWVIGDLAPGNIVTGLFHSSRFEVRADIKIANVIDRFRNGAYFRGQVTRLEVHPRYPEKDEIEVRELFRAPGHAPGCTTGLPDPTSMEALPTQAW